MGGGYSQSYIDTALSGKAESSHTHGNITNDGKVGTTANKPLITGTGGVVQAGSFGNAANTFCEGNDSRLSDARTPVAHTHVTSDVTDLLSNTHTWTSQQSYNSDLNLNYASTDVDDIVNSVAGSATLDNFVHLTGNETVNGVKSFPDGIVADVTGSATSATNDGSGNVISTTYGKLGAANTWSGENTFSYVSPIRLKNDNIEKGVQPTNFQNRSILFRDKNNSDVAYIRHIVNQSGLTDWIADGLEFSVQNKFANGTLDPTGTNTTGTFRIGFWTDGQKYIYNEFRWRSSLLPFNNQEQNIGSSTNQWNNLYAKNYYYNGTPWGLDKANVWTDRNLYENYSLTIRDNNVQDTTAPDNDIGKGIVEVWNKDNHYWGGLGYRWVTNGNSELIISLSNWNGNAQGYWEYKIGVNKAFNDLYFAPPHNLVNLGTSAAKWKSLNGVNPGALGLPISSYVEIDTSNWDLTGATGQSYTPTVHGWIFISIQNIAGNYLSIVSGRGAVSIDGTGAQGGLRAMLPVVANESVGIMVKTGIIFAARFYPCQGNV